MLTVYQYPNLDISNSDMMQTKIHMYVEIEDKLFLVDRTKLQNDLQTSDRVCLSEVCLVNSEEAAARAEVSVIYK